MGDEHAVFPYRIEVVVGHLGGRVPMRTVVVVPVLGGHEGRNAQAQHGNAAGDGLRRHLLHEGRCRQPLVERHHAQADPDGKHIERARIGIVAFPHLVRRLVEVQHDGDARHEEHEKHKPAAALVLVKLEHQAQQAQQQRQEEIVVLALVAGQRRRSVGLVSEAHGVQEADTAFPVAVENVPGHRGMDVVLAPHEVPHEVAPVHPVELIVKEVGQIGPEGGLAVGSPLHARALSLRVRLVEIDEAGIGR